MVKKIYKFFTKQYSCDMSKHRVYTTNYEDLCQ